VKEKAIFTHQLATMLKAGLQMTSALESLSKQTRSKQLTMVISQIHSDIEHSDSLSQAMSKHPVIFSKVYTSVIEAAEKSGSLPQTLAILSKQLKNQSSVNSRIKSALAYPIFLLAASVMVIGVLMTFVIPKFIALFVNANQKLPLPTKILVTITNGFREFWPVFIIVITAGVCFILVSLKNKRVRAFLDGWLLKLPIIGPFNRKIQLARFTRTLGSLLAGGVRITSAIRTTAGAGGNIAFAGQIANIEQSITKGSTLAKAIREQKFFSEVAANMISVGEETSTLPEMLDEIAQMHDEESEAAVNSLTALLGPAMIVVLGLIIAFVVMAILMPIFETSTMVG
ncbi:MAG: type II secretion system F family protein, partial [Planctomycetes bacterium]|nr:type II secretion system F family protein [Planctomycetota bacterium]